ncbi:MAG: zinc ribbon domain-containing protein [Oscillospiraceae bacterium]|nr:zinc ribbon domain-containing protein [Oscillospiraceae bacterium]
MATCNSCGASVPGGVKFCTVCGASMEQAAPAAAAPPLSSQPGYQPQPTPADERPAKGSVYAPISTLGYIGYFLLFSIPVIGQILLIAFAFGKKGNVNRKALARAMFIFMVLALVLGLVFGILMATVFKTIEREIPNETGGGIVSWLQGIGGGDKDDKNDNDDDNDPSYLQPDNDGNDAPAQTTQAPRQTENAPAASAKTPDEFNEVFSAFSAGWPENEFTRRVPKPNFEVAFGSANETEYVALGGGATVEQLREYVKQLEKAGFNKNAQTEDQSVFGMTTYSYKANNGKGYEVEIGYVSMMNINTITIRKI